MRGREDVPATKLLRKKDSVSEHDHEKNQELLEHTFKGIGKKKLNKIDPRPFQNTTTPDSLWMHKINVEYVIENSRGGEVDTEKVQFLISIESNITPKVKP